MDLYVIRRPSAWANLQELEAAGAAGNAAASSIMSTAPVCAAFAWRSRIGVRLASAE